MSRAKRMQPVADVAQHRQDQAAQRMGSQQLQLAQQEKRLEDLRNYRDEYNGRFYSDGQVMAAVQVREYRLFLARLDQAIDEQTQHVEMARQALERSHKDWSACRVQTDAINKAIERMQADEQQVERRREQGQNDEFGQRIFWHSR